MSETQWRVYLLGGDAGDCFSIPVLFDSAAQHMQRAFPAGWIVTGQPKPDGAPGRSAQFAAVARQQDGFVLLCAAPLPTVETAQWESLTQLCADETHCAALCDGGQALSLALHTSVLRQCRQAQSMEQLYQLVRQTGCTVHSLPLDGHPAVTGPLGAGRAQKILQQRIAEKLMQRGVWIFDPAQCWIAADADIGAGTRILPGTMVQPHCTIGGHCTIGPNTVLRACVVGDRTTVNASQVLDSTIGADCELGPFAYVRPHCTIGDRVKVGDFVEVKNSTVADDTKAAHLTYIGDADVGQRVNFGCGTVVVNYDGYDKHRTVIGDDCFLGCNTNLVAPIALGDRVLTAAGSTVTESVEDGALAIARARQQTKPGWNDRRRDARQSLKKQ